MKKHFNNAIFMSVKLFAAAPGPLKGCDSPLSDVSMRAFIRVEEILRIVMNCVLINNDKATGIKLVACMVIIMSAVIKLLRS
jgi:hypothetical protein